MAPGYAIEVHLTMTDDHPWAQAFVILTPARWSLDCPVATVTATAAPVPTEPAKVRAWSGVDQGLFWYCRGARLHSFIAKPFYIPSESMTPNPLTGDRLVVTKSLRLVLRRRPFPIRRRSSATCAAPGEPLTITLLSLKGRSGACPARMCHRHPPGGNQDYIKRVIGFRATVRFAMAG
jgi:hypothetical protein